MRVFFYRKMIIALVVLIISLIYVGESQPAYATTNLLTNGDFEAGDSTGWTIIENGGSGATFSAHVYATSYTWDSISQTVDLVAAGYSADALDAAPSIQFNVDTMQRFDHNGEYYLEFKLLAANGTTVVTSTLYGSSSSPIALSAGTDWFGSTTTFSGYGTGVRYAYIKIAGRDGSPDWGGQYGPYFDNASITVADTTNPTVSSLSPADDATGVSVTSTLVITFDEDIVTSTGNIYLYNASDASLVETIDITSALVTASSTTALVIDPTSTLSSDTSYYILMDATAVDDTSGNSFAGISASTTWSFTTPDTIAPTIDTLSPADGATSVSFSANLVLTFDEVVNVASGTIRLYHATDDTLLSTISVTSTEVTGDGTTTITINPDQPLFPGTEYYVLISAGAFEDDASNAFAGISSSSTWDFTTANAGSSSRIGVSPSSATISEQDGTQVISFTLTEPLITPDGEDEGLTIYLVSSDTGECELSASSVSWENDEWAQTRTVTLAAIDDDAERNDTATVYWVVLTTAEYYDGLSGSIAITLTDDDATVADDNEDVGSSGSGGGAYIPLPPMVVNDILTPHEGNSSPAYTTTHAFRINGGAAVTNNRRVTLTFTGIERAVEVAISEDPLFQEVSYHPFSPTETFDVSSGFGIKQIYARFRSAQGETLTLVQNIALTKQNLSSSDSTPETTPCQVPSYPTKPISLSRKNDPEQVRLLETFLNTYEGAQLSVNGIYEQSDIAAVIAWQETYAAEILLPLGISKGTGNIYSASLSHIQKRAQALCSSVVSAPVATSPGTQTQCLSTSTQLSLGQKSAWVATAQRLLKTLGYFPADIDATGYFGSITEAAVKAFQSAHGIETLGIIGPQTREMLNTLGCTQ